MRPHIIYIVLLAVLCMLSCKRKPDMSPEATFDAAWKIMDEHYCYFSERNIDWNGVYDVYRPKVDAVNGPFELFDLIAEMLNTLGDGHVNLITPLGISSSSGWFDDYPMDFSWEILSDEEYLGKDYRSAGDLVYDTIGDVGYLRVTSFSSVSRSSLMYIDLYFQNCKGIIVDVRSNGGGDMSLASGLAASFFKEKTLTGFIRHKLSSGHDDFSEPEPLYTDPDEALIDWKRRQVVVLTNRRAFSATNSFVSAMRLAPHCTIVGGVTGGGGGLPLSNELPNGWQLRFSAVPMYGADTVSIEFGVKPDVEVHQTEDDIANRRDPLVDYAINIIHAEELNPQ